MTFVTFKTCISLFWGVALRAPRRKKRKRKKKDADYNITDSLICLFQATVVEMTWQRSWAVAEGSEGSWGTAKKICYWRKLPIPMGLPGTSQTIWNWSLNSHRDWGTHRDKTAGELTELSTLQPSALASRRLRLDWSHWKIVPAFAILCFRRHRLSIPREKNIHTCLIISNTIDTGNLWQISENKQLCPLSLFLLAFQRFSLFQGKGIFAISGNKDKLIRNCRKVIERVLLSTFKMYF